MSSFDHQLDAPQNKKDLWGPFNHLGILWCNGKLSGRKRPLRNEIRGKGYGGTAEFWISAKHQRKAEECRGCRPCFPSIWKKGLIDNIKAQGRRKPGGPGWLEGHWGLPFNFWLLIEEQKRSQGEPLASPTIFGPNWRNKIFFFLLAPPNFFTFRRSLIKLPICQLHQSTTSDEQKQTTQQIWNISIYCIKTTTKYPVWKNLLLLLSSRYFIVGGLY